MIAHRDVSGVGTDHPYRNLQPPARWVYNRDGTISPFWSPGDSQTITVQRMKRIENADMRGIRTQGTMGGFGTIPTFTASFPQAASSPDRASWVRSAISVLSAGKGPQSRVPRQVLRRTETSLSTQTTALCRASVPVGRAETVPSASAPPASPGLGGLRQACLRRSGESLTLSGPVYPSSRYLQSPPAGVRWSATSPSAGRTMLTAASSAK